jgi:hypothetical protein
MYLMWRRMQLYPEAGNMKILPAKGQYNYLGDRERCDRRMKPLYAKHTLSTFKAQPWGTARLALREPPQVDEYEEATVGTSGVLSWWLVEELFRRAKGS